MSERYRPNRSSRGDEVRVKREHRSRSRSLSRERRRRSKHDSSHERKRSHKKNVKKERSRTRSLSSTSSDEESRLDKLLDKKRLERFQKEREEKRRRKELETPDEKRSRRLAKKLQKEERRRAEALSAFPEGIPYTDLNNPFNDTSLTETFVWKKKWETEGKADISRKKVEKINRNIIAKNFAEMETLKRNREARDAAREDMEMIARDQDRRLCDWNRTEDVFHLKQAGLRSEIRIKEGRGKPIDFIGRYIAYTEEENKAEEFELDQNVLSYFPTDSIDDFEDLIADIKIYRVIDGGKNKSYWDDIEIVAKSGLKKLMENRHRSTDSGTVHSSVQEEVLKIFKGKSYDELEQLESQIGAKIKNARKGTDVSYWESLLDQLRPYMAKQRLRELHTKMQQLRLKRLREEQMQDLGIEEEDEEDEEEEKEGEAKKHVDVERPTKTTSIDKKEEEAEMMEMDEEEKVPILAEEVEKVEELTMKQIEEVIEEEQKPAKTTTVSLQREGVAGGGSSAEQRQPTLPFSIESMLKLEDDQREQCYQILETRLLIDQFGLASYEHGRYSPVYGTETQIMPGIEILDECEDAESLAITRSKHRQEGGGGGAQSSAEDQRLMEIAKKGMTKDEAVFAVEEALEKQHFLWSDKYRPRKPRYFNRVHTGFDWNKYNQTHYDIDNPPPKIVQGYRFNIFYPDLLDPTQTPKFQLIKCEGDVDFAILRFQAGPPYEDIAFKIVNREWEVSYKHGYKCQFQNGVFQLWFFFKRYRYRR